jgi:hypothetical protein
MNFGELKQAILADSHRPDLPSEVARFVRECEGMIRRELRAFVQTGTLGESDRVAGGVYQLPPYLLELRSLYLTGADGDALEQVSLLTVRRFSGPEPLQYAMRGATIEIRGTPATDASFDLEYLGHPPPLVDDTDTNSLLTDHEAIYTQGALFYLYQHTQDLELAQAALDIWTDAVNKLNEQIGRKLGGASVSGAYNFGHGGAY